MSGMKIRKGDTVKVLVGREKGKTGKVTATNPTKHTVTVDGINIRTIHKKPSTAYPQGGVIKESQPIDASNVGYVNGKKTSRIGYDMKKNKKVRVLRQSSNKEIK
jgi:large subunit ribosomal protein L24